jgi:Fe-S-cluster-containing hydrogenase component 2
MEQKNSPSTPGAAQEMSRREFIATAVTGVFALGAVGVGGLGFFKPSATPIDRESSGVIFADPTLCIGCLTCEVACSQAHSEVGLSSLSRIRIYDEPKTVVDAEVTKNYPGRGNHLQHVCLQCPDAPCVPVCPVNAMHLDAKTGAREIDEIKCIACGRCAEACPFEVRPESMATEQLPKPTGQKTRITYDPAKNVYTKCDLCSFRPEGPACIQKCPIDIRIKQGVLKVDAGRMCLDLPKSDKATFAKQRAIQTYKKS